jgi:uncharacterized membrane protein
MEPKVREEQILLGTYSLKSLLIVLGNGLLASLWACFAYLRPHGFGGQAFVLTTAAMLLAFTGSWWALTRLHCSTASVTPARSGRMIAHCFDCCLLLLFFLPEYFFGKEVNRTKSDLLIAGVLALFFIFIWLSLRQVNVSGTREKRNEMYWLAFLGAYFLATTYLALQKFDNFGYVGQDLGYFCQIFHTTIHGSWFYGNVFQDVYYDHPVRSDFASHNSLIMLVFLPFYYLHESPSTLLVVRNLFMVGSAWPAFLLARRHFSAGQSYLVSAFFLFLPCILYQNVYDFYPLSTVAFFALFTFYFYLERSFRYFLIFVVLMLFVREELVVAVVCLGLLALWHRRGAIWIFAPIGIAVAWGVVTYGFILPHYLNGSRFLAEATCFAGLGSSKAEIVFNVLHHPFHYLFRRGNIIYLKQLIAPFSGVMLTDSASLLSLPYIIVNLLAGGDPCSTTLIFAHYSVIPTVLLFLGFLLSLRKADALWSRMGHDAFKTRTGVLVFLVALTLTSTMFATDWKQIQEFRPKHWQAEAKMVAKMIPPNAPVAAPRYLLPTLANRYSLYATHRLLDYHDPNPQYVIIDRDWSRLGADQKWKLEYDVLSSWLEHNDNFIVTYMSPNYIIYSRVSPTKGSVLPLPSR